MDADNHSCPNLRDWLRAELARKDAEIKKLKRRLEEERYWGHKTCIPGNCMSSGIDCPKQEVSE